MDGDTIPPWIENLAPASGQGDVDPKTTVQFDVLDSTGIDLNSLYVSLFNMTLNSNIPFKLTEKTEISKGKSSGYHVVATPGNTIGYNDSIEVRIFAIDLEQNEMADTLHYLFNTIEDIKGPSIVVYSPVGEKVEIKPHFRIQIKDTLSGVDTASVVFSWKYQGEVEENIIDKKLYQSVKELNPGSLFEYVFFLEDRLDYDTTVELFARAKDKENNPGSKHSTITTRKYDEDPPWIEYVDPKPDIELPFSQTIFSFKLGDDLTFVNKERIIVDIHTDTVGQNGAQEFREWHFKYNDGLMDITEEKNYLVVNCEPPDDDPFRFYFNDKVEMKVFATDSCENDTTFHAAFNTRQDNDAPYLVSSEPEDRSTNNPLDTGIKLVLSDDLSGILLNTIRVRMLDKPMYEGEPDSLAWENAPMLYPGLMKKVFPMQALAAAAKVELEMPAGSINFDFNRTIWLWIYAEDNVERFPNKLDMVISFGSEEKLSDLLFISANFPPQKYSVGDTVKITAKVANKFAAVAAMFDITFAFEGEEDIHDSVMVQPVFNAPDGKDYEGSLPLNAQGKYRIVITVDKENSVMEQDETNNVFYLPIDVVDGKLEVKSNPFTPNGDGLNDDAYFNCEQFKLEAPTVKIFDIRGRFIKELTQNDLIGKKFKWDGRDKNGNEVMPGVFLFILQDKGHAIKNGCVVVAR